MRRRIVCGEVQARRSRRLEWRSVWKGNQERRRNGGRKTKKKTYIEVEGQFVMIVHMCAVLEVKLHLLCSVTDVCL